MDKLLTITYPPKRPHVLLGVAYTNAAYFQARIDEVGGKVFEGWKVTDISDTPEKTKEGLKKIEGDAEYIDMEKWGLTKKRWATPSLMRRLDELSPLIEMDNVHKITYPDSAGEPIVDYTNSRQFIKRIKEELPPGLSWSCVPIHVENEAALKEFRDGEGGSRRIIKGPTKDGKGPGFRFWVGYQGEEGGDDGWCRKRLYNALTEILQAHTDRIRTGERIAKGPGEEQAEVRVEDEAKDMVKGPVEGTVEDTVQDTAEDALLPSKKIPERRII